MLEIEESKLESGVRVADRYRLDHVLGEGGMGVVWEAVDETSGEVRALKFIRRDKCGDGRSVARLLREANAASAIVHPNVAQVFCVLELPEGTPFLVMERLEGETLKTRLARVGKLAALEVTPIALAIAEGVRAVHALGIVHRDLKPDNVFILADGRVKVIDFGIAKDLRAETQTELTTTGAMLGTLHYMAPEQVFGDVDIDERVDVWALGVVLYECLAGRRPTEGSGSGQVLKAIMTQTFTPLVEAAPGCPVSLSELVEQMLSRDRSERPTLDDVIDRLEGRASRVSRRPVRAVAAASAPNKSGRLFAAAMVVGLAGLGVGVALRGTSTRAVGPEVASASTTLFSSSTPSASAPHPTALAASGVALPASVASVRASASPTMTAILPAPMPSAKGHVGVRVPGSLGTSPSTAAPPVSSPPSSAPPPSALPLATSRKT